jgi:hypothetical protein
MSKVSLTWEQVKELIDRSVSDKGSIKLLIEFGDAQDKEIKRLSEEVEILKREKDGHE